MVLSSRKFYRQWAVKGLSALPIFPTTFMPGHGSSRRNYQDEDGCMVYTGLAPRRLQFHVAPAMPAL